MKKALSILICITLVLGIMTVPVSAAGSTVANATIWSAITDGALTTDVTLKDGKTSIDNTYFPGTIQDVADWNGQYNMVEAVLPSAISGKTVKLSFDYFGESSAWGAPSFRVNVFDQTGSYAEGGTNCYIGFYAYDAPGNNEHVAVDGVRPTYYDETKSYFTYYGSENGYNTAPTAESGKAKMKHRVWQHIDCVYDLVNQKVTYFVDGVQLGTAKGPSAIAALAFKKTNYASSTTVYYGVVRFDNIKITEVNAGGLSWNLTAEAETNNLLIDFSEPVTNLTEEMISVTDMETLAAASVSSVEQITPYQWRVNLDGAKKNAEYKVAVSAITSDFGGTSQAETVFAYTVDEESFGVKKVRYDAKVSNIATSVASNYAEDFADYTIADDPGKNKTNANDYADASDGAWSRSGHTKTGSWWGQGTYVNSLYQLSIDNYANGSPLSVGAIRNIGSNMKGKIFNVSFNTAYYNEDPHGKSYYTIFAGSEPVVTIDRSAIYLHNELKLNDKQQIATNGFKKATYGKDLVTMNLSFDFVSKKVKVQVGSDVFYTMMSDSLVANGFDVLKFVVALVEGVNNNGNSNGTWRGNAAVVDNYSEEITNVSDAGTYDEGLELSNEISATTTNVDIEFTDAVDEATIAGITIVDGKGGSVAYTPTLSGDGKMLSLGVTLKQNTDYTLNIPVTVVSADEVANARAYAFTFATDSAIKFYDNTGNELNEAALKTATSASYEISAPAPTGTDGVCLVLVVTYNKEDDSMKNANVNRISYKVGEIVESSNTITVSDGEYARFFFWDSIGSLNSVFGKSYSIGK